VDVAALIIGSVALVVAVGFGIWQTLFNKKVEQQLLGSGTTLLEVNWTWKSEKGPVQCYVQAKEVPLADVSISFKKEKRFLDSLPAHGARTVEFSRVDKGEKWTVEFVDPTGRRHRESYQIWGNGVELFG